MVTLSVIWAVNEANASAADAQVFRDFDLRHDTENGEIGIPVGDDSHIFVFSLVCLAF